MSILLECPGCRRGLQVPDSCAGMQARCPACGAVLAVPAAAAAITATAPPLAASPAAPPPAPSTASCTTCGRTFALPDNFEGSRIRCPFCGDLAPVRADVAFPAARPAKPSYVVHEMDDRPCPECGQRLPRQAVLCVACGYHLQTGAKLETTYERFETEWTRGLPLLPRLVVFAAVECLFLPALLVDDLFFGVVVLFGAAVFWAVFFGTFYEVTLVRNTRGKVWLTKRWRVCFLPAFRTVINVRAYRRVLLDYAHGFDLVDWLIVALGFGFGVIGGFMYLVIMQNASGGSAPGVHTLVLEEESGDRVTVWRGWSHTKMTEILEDLREVAGLEFGR
jgi:hypothetical protein